MKSLKNMKETLVAATQAQLTNLEQADSKELGCAIDMIKDLSEAIYYCEIVKSMEKAEERQEKEAELMMMYEQAPGASSRMYYQEPRYPRYNRGHQMSSRNRQSTQYPATQEYNTPEAHEFEYYEAQRQYEKDPREGRSPTRRKTYMESRLMDDKNMHIKELEMYIQELGQDILEMIQGASAEERQMLHRKLVVLANKVQQADE